MKIFLLLLASVAAVHITHSATLRRKPKVYNALITTDQNLTPSRAFPVVQSHLQETYAYPSYSYRSYSPLGLYNNGFPYGSAPYNGFHSYPRINTGLVEARNFFPRDEIRSTLPPIPHDFGLPPSLVPINSFGNLAPYPYNPYLPIVYDQFGGNGFLPPYPFYPPGFDALPENSPDKSKGDDAGKDENDKNDKNDSPAGKNGGSDEGSSGGSSSGSSAGKSSGSSEGSSGGGSGGSSDSSSSTSSSTKSSRSRNFDKPEYPPQQSLNEKIKNFPNKDHTIPDINPSPPVRVNASNK